MTVAAEGDVDPFAFDVAVPFPRAADPLLMAAMAVAVTLAAGVDLVLVALVPWALVLGAISGVDFRELRVPNRMVGPATAMAVPLLIIASLSDIEGVSLVRALLGAVAALVFYLAIHLASPASMGMGDVKLAPYIGAHVALFSWESWFGALLYAFFAMAIVGLALLAIRRAGRKAALPFAPFMATGAVISLFMTV